MDKSEVAAILEEIAMMLELQGENPFRAQAYAKAGHTIAQLETSLADVVAEGKLGDIPGIGETLREKITLLVTTGKLPFYEDLKKKTPPGLITMLRLPGVGPKKIKLLYDKLGIDTVEKLKEACEAGTVATLKGFGAKTQQNILEGISFIDQSGQRVRLDQAQLVAEVLSTQLRTVPGLHRLEVCGSLRRRKETVADIDLLATAKDPVAVMEAFVHLPQVQKVIGQGETKASVVVQVISPGGTRIIMNVDLRVVSYEQFPFALNYFTGSKEHNVQMRQRAIERGLKLNEYALAGEHKNVRCKDEAELYRALDLDYVEPVLREHTGEIEAAAAHALPRLLEAKDIKGVFHCHTDWSDGRATLAEMAEAAQALGYHYLGIADHSQSLAMTNGLTPERVRLQQKEIDKLNAGFKDFRLFKGTECDILADGSLDYDDKLLATFDYVVASVHSHFNQPQEEMTARIVRAISHPRVTMLGHATGRLLMRRDGYKVDLDAVIHAAAKHGTMIEINADPHRLDLDWVHCKRAKALGVKLVINPDAHSTGGIANTTFGVDVARRAWLEKADVFNTQTLAQVTKALTTRKQAISPPA
jgi:DNA polymerase (family 10)